MIWQVIKITEEIVKVMGTQPEKIFVEMARAKEDRPERKNSRKTQLEQLYESIKKDEKFLYDELIKKDESEFKIKKVYLYFMQLGKCMYSGENIDLNLSLIHI